MVRLSTSIPSRVPRPWLTRHTALVAAVLAAALLILPPFVGSSRADSYPTLSQIQSACADSGWTAGSNPIWNLSWTEKSKRLGLILPTTEEEELGTRSELMPSDDLPAAWDWRNVNGRSYVSSVKNQGSCGSCWAFAACGALESLREIHNDTECAIENLSEQFLVSCCKGNSGCDGGNPTKTANCLRDTGTVSEICFPYTAADDPCSDACDDWSSELRSISAWSWSSTYPRYPTLSELKTAVKRAPVWTTLMVYADFYAYKSGVYRHVVGPLMGGHAVLMVGYNDTTRSFTCKNSWGASWGESGYFRVAYSQLAPGGCQFGRWTQDYYLGMVACWPYDVDETVAFEWEEVTGAGTTSELTPVSFPFNIKYFCSEQSSGSISINGWTSMVDYGVSSWPEYSTIPSDTGPPSMVAPLWTDLVATGRNSGVYHGDTGDGRFVVEYREMSHAEDPTALETFEIIYYDPELYPTKTGDARIRFQYLQHSPQIDLYPGYTVGIENDPQTCGTQYYSSLEPALPDGGEAAGEARAPEWGRGGGGTYYRGPVYPGLAIEFTAIPDGENDVQPEQVGGLTAIYDEPYVVLDWTNPLDDTRGFELDFLDGGTAHCDGEAIAYSGGEPGDAMSYEYREQATGSHNYEVAVHVGARWSDTSAVELNIPPRVDIADHDVGNVRFSVTDMGICGYLDGTQAEGSGFRYGGTEDSWLYLGGLWAATDTAYALNRDFDADPYADWMFRADIESPSPAHSDQDYLAVFDDGGHPFPRGLQVTQRSMAWDDAPYDDFAILDYELLNAGDTMLERLCVGQYMDWDIPPGSGGENSAGTDTLLQLAYMWRDAGYPYVGVALLETEPGAGPPVSNLTLVHNATYVYPTEYLLDTDRYLFLSGGDPEHVVPQMHEVADWSALVAAGPFDLDAGASVTVPFAVVGGDDYADLVANVARAQELYTALGVNVPGDAPIEYRLELGQNRPNPFNPVTSIRYVLPQAGRARLSVYDAAGRLVATLVDGPVKAGPHATAWDGTNDEGMQVSSGVYFCRLEAAGETRAMKMVLLK